MPGNEPGNNFAQIDEYIFLEVLTVMCSSFEEDNS